MMVCVVDSISQLGLPTFTKDNSRKGQIFFLERANSVRFVGDVSVISIGASTNSFALEYDCI